MPALTLSRITRISVARAKRWHPNGGLQAWLALEWAGAMAGEAGEACNAAKKLKRIEDRIKNINKEKGRSLKTLEKAKDKICKELADTILYAVLVAARVDGDIEAAVVEAFNKKSIDYNFPERL